MIVADSAGGDAMVATESQPTVWLGTIYTVWIGQLKSNNHEEA